MTDRELLLERLERLAIVLDELMPQCAELVRDTIAMLKEQEPRILDWDEIRNYPVVYGEFRGVKDIYPLIITVDSWGRCLSWNPGINVSKEFILVVSDEEDRKNTRCWNKMPTEEQRQAVKWDERKTND